MAYFQQYESPRYPNDCDGRCGQQQNYGYNQSEYSYIEEQGHHSLPQGQIVRVCSKANPDYALVKDESWSNRVRDTVGHLAFGLVNKATGQALHHAPAACQEVLLTKYEGCSYDESVLWSESEDMGYGYRTIRLANGIGLNLDAFQGDRKHGGIEEGTRVVVWKWNKQDNQLWKISPCY
ncbi:hypothetical protein SUGI_1133660 [Cryptomeria japonica]|nr:hypothetical protein SUGI_1133660 [Cryptomeria japonica]